MISTNLAEELRLIAAWKTPAGPTPAMKGRRWDIVCNEGASHIDDLESAWKDCTARLEATTQSMLAHVEACLMDERTIAALREQLAERDVRISELENVECGQAALVNKLMSVEAFVWKVTTPAGDSCHFGDESGALAYARETGTVERIRLAPRNFHIVSAELANRAGKEPS